MVIEEGEPEQTFSAILQETTKGEFVKSNKSLASVFNERIGQRNVRGGQQQQQARGQQNASPADDTSFVAYLRAFIQTINECYPPTATIDDLDYDTVKNLCDRTLLATDVAVERWEDRHNIASASSLSQVS